MQKLPHKSHTSSGQKGFTLIELLIVIVIIGILSGVLLSVINPVRQQQKANETVMRSNLNKIKMALMACVNSTETPSKCATHSNWRTDNSGDDCADGLCWDNLGVNSPQGEPKTETRYSVVSVSSTRIQIYAFLDRVAYVARSPESSCCYMRFLYNPSTGEETEEANYDCLVDYGVSRTRF